MLPSLIANKITFPSSSSIGKFLILLFGVGLLPPFSNSVLSELRGLQYLPLEAQLCLPIGDCLLLEVADTPEEKSIGLMGRTVLSKGTGMWFQFSPAKIVKFWMHNMNIPVDMIFISDGFITAIETNLPTCLLSKCPKYGPSKLVDGVIELTAGEVERLDIKVGDFVDLRYR